MEQLAASTILLKRVLVQDRPQSEFDLLVRQLEQQLKSNVNNADKIKFDSAKISSVQFLHSAIENLTIRLNHAHIVQYAEWIKPTITAYKANQQNYRAKLVELFSSSLHLRLDPENSIKCHNVCVLIIMLQELPDFVTQLSPQLVYTFLMRNLFTVKTFFNDPQRMINLFVVIDRLSLSKEYKVQLLNCESSLLATLWWCADLYGQSDCVTRLVNQSRNEQITYMHLQVGFCARWFLERILLGQTVSNCPSNHAALNRLDKSKHLKLSPDCLSARSDWKWQYVRSTRAVDSGVYYYEVVLITGGPMRIGWTYTTSKRTSLVVDKINEEIFTIALNGHDKCMYRKKRERFNKNTEIQNINLKLKCQWSPGDVVGCLINFDKFKFEFYLNGQLIQLENVYKYIPEGQRSYYASISLYEHQQCYCNFGQIDFKYAPKDMKFKYFYNNDNNVINLNHIESKSEQKWYEFKEDVLVYDRVELLFDDQKQIQIDELVIQIEQNIYSKQPLVIDLSREYECLRMIQSIIEQIETLLGTKLDLLINWIDQHLIRHLTVNVNPLFPDLLCQVLYPYFQLHLTPDTIITHRNVCAMLCLLSSVISNLNIRVNLHKQFITYLCNLVINYCDLFITDDDQANDGQADEWMLLLAIVTLGNLDLDDTTKQTLRDNAKICKVLEAQSYSTCIENVANYNPQKSKYLLLQSQFCTQWFLGNVLNKTEGTSATADNLVVAVEKPTKLSAKNCTSKVKLSQDRLVARSDSNWQSVRSNCSTSESTYYEVTLHTNGPMRIGWATKQSDFIQSLIGTDRHSIGYDGFNRLVWHDNVSYPLNVTQWTAGDIVGCLISRGKFFFYLNECPIEFPDLIHCSSKPYYAAASLSTQQQCAFNFSQTVYHSRRPSSHNFDSIQRIKLYKHNLYLQFRKRLGLIKVKNGIFADNSQLQFHGNFQMIYNGRNINSSEEQASCSTESTLDSTRIEMPFSLLDSVQLCNEIANDENGEDKEVDDDELEDILEMINDESEV